MEVGQWRISRRWAVHVATPLAACTKSRNQEIVSAELTFEMRK